VLSRWFALTEPPQSPGGKAALWALAESLIPRRRAREFNQALMELGALLCQPREPLCGLCPLRERCRAFAEGRPEAYPVPKGRRARRRIEALLAVLVRRGRGDGRVLLRRRPAEGLWGGLWEFPWVEAGAGEGEDKLLPRLLSGLGLRAAGPARALGEVRHGLTHREFAWRCVAAPVRIPRAPARGGGPRGARENAVVTCWADAEAIAALPLGRPMRKVLELWRRVAH
jgi:A/G-specific adenine glycosylase